MKQKNVIYKCAKCEEPFNPFYPRPGEDPQRFCSVDCYREDRWGKTEESRCETCNEVITGPHKRRRKYCSFKCSKGRQNDNLIPTPRNRVTRPCDWCGEDTTKCLSNDKYEHYFCSTSCAGAWRSHYLKGENSAVWKGGSRHTYQGGWAKARRNAMDRANGKCQRCKTAKATCVHHVLPVRYFAHDRDAHFDSNLRALCRSCHTVEEQAAKQAAPLLNLLDRPRQKNPM